MRSERIDLNGPVHFADFGGEGRPVVLVHGLGGSHVNWLPVGAPLTRYGRVVAPDLVGFGHTPLAGRSATVPANVALLERFLDSLGGGPAVLVGNSMGGLISVLLAARAPERVGALVLVGPAQPRPLWRSFDPLVSLMFGAYWLPGLGELVTRRALAVSEEQYVQGMLQLCCANAGGVSEDVVRAHVELARRRRVESPDAPAAFLEAARSLRPYVLGAASFKPALDRVQTPGLIVQGDRDRLVPLVASHALAKARPDWTLEVLDGLGHLPQLEDPERFVRVVGGWLEREGAAA